MNVTIVVVTYNRSDLLLKNINALLSQTYTPDTIIIIDNNSTDGTEHTLKENGYLDNKTIIYHKLPNNLGSSGGFKKAIQYAYMRGAEWIWGMDDDAIPKPDALEQLVRYAQSNPHACYWSNADCDNEGYINGIKETEHWMFVGFLLPKFVVDTVGLPREEFFIYHDDFEYARRILKKNIKIYKVQSSVIEHTYYSKEGARQGLLFGKCYSFPIMSDWKVYYLTRNRLLSFSFTEIGKYRAFVGVWRKIGLPILATNPRQFKMFLKGYFHGLIGKSGKIVEPSI